MGMKSDWDAFFLSGKVKDYLNLKENERSQEQKDVTIEAKDSLSDFLRFEQGNRLAKEHERYD